MSRCILDDEDRKTQVLIGWDRDMQWFFARVRDRDFFPEEKRAAKPESEAGAYLWTGGFDRIWTTPDLLIDLIQTYACRHDKGRLGVRRRRSAFARQRDACDALARLTRVWGACSAYPPTRAREGAWSFRRVFVAPVSQR